MKRFLFLLAFFSLLVLSIGAQTSVNNGIPQKNVTHLRFQGIPITGNIKSFCTKMSQKGYKFDYSYPDEVAFWGRYMGHKAKVRIYADKGIVYCVSVDIPFYKKDDAEDLRTDILQGLKQKYPRLQYSETESGTFTDAAQAEIDQQVYDVPRESKGPIDWKNLLGEFCITLEDVLIGEYSYALKISYTDEYNSPEWREARLEYIKAKKIADKL